MSPLHWPPASAGRDTGEVSPPIGGGGPGKFSYFRCKMAHSEAIFWFLFVYLSLLKVLWSWVNRFWKNLSVALSDDSIVLWTAALQEHNAER